MIKEKIIKTEVIIENIIEGIQKKKGQEITIIDLAELTNAFCDKFIICHGDSNRQVTAIADSVEEVCIENIHITPFHKEGYQNAKWILLDFGMTIVHIFQKETRNFYQLEDLWADGKFERINDE